MRRAELVSRGPVAVGPAGGSAVLDPDGFPRDIVSVVVGAAHADQSRLSSHPTAPAPYDRARTSAWWSRPGSQSPSTSRGPLRGAADQGGVRHLHAQLPSRVGLAQAEKPPQGSRRRTRAARGPQHSQPGEEPHHRRRDTTSVDWAEVVCERAMSGRPMSPTRGTSRRQRPSSQPVGGRTRTCSRSPYRRGVLTVNPNMPTPASTDFFAAQDAASGWSRAPHEPRIIAVVAPQGRWYDQKMADGPATFDDARETAPVTAANTWRQDSADAACSACSNSSGRGLSDQPVRRWSGSAITNRLTGAWLRRYAKASACRASARVDQPEPLPQRMHVPNVWHTALMLHVRWCARNTRTGPPQISRWQRLPCRRPPRRRKTARRA